VNVRELQALDLRCKSCDAAPGEGCIDRMIGGATFVAFEPHLSRRHEAAGLASEGWQWQEVDPRDDGAPRPRK